jgi:hypothetical protein
MKGVRPRSHSQKKAPSTQGREARVNLSLTLARASLSKR